MSVAGAPELRRALATCPRDQWRSTTLRTWLPSPRAQEQVRHRGLTDPGILDAQSEELATVALAQADAESRYLLRKAHGKPAVGLQLPDKLDGDDRVVRGRAVMQTCHRTRDGMTWDTTLRFTP